MNDLLLASLTPNYHPTNAQAMLPLIACNAIVLTAVLIAYLHGKRKRICPECGQELRHDETPHEITGCPTPGLIGYIEKGRDRSKQTVGFDKIEHRTIGTDQDFDPHSAASLLVAIERRKTEGRLFDLQKRMEKDGYSVRHSNDI